MKIELFEWPEGDWVALYVDGKCYEEGHSIPKRVWLELLKDAGCEVTIAEVNDEDGWLCRQGVDTLRANTR